MKGLILKDFYMLKHYCRTYVLIVAAFIAISFFGDDNIFFLAYPCILSSILPNTLISYDEHFRWNIYSSTLPYTRKQLVSVKYIISLILGFSSLILCMAVFAVRMVINQHFSAPQFFSIGIIMICLNLIIPTFVLPILFKFGTEKGRIIYFAVFGVFGAGLAVSAKAASMFSENVSFEVSNFMIMIVAVVTFAAAFAISWKISISIYKKREF